MQTFTKYMSAKKILVLSTLFGFFFAYLSSISVFKYGDVLESGSTSITNTLFGSKVEQSVKLSSAANIFDTITAKMSVTVDGITYYYSDFNKAIEDAPNNKEYKITLLNSIKLKEPVKIPANKKIIIDGANKHTIKRYKNVYNVWYNDRLFYIDNSAELTLTNITLDLGNEWNLDEDGYKEALNKQESVDTDKFLEHPKNSALATNWVIYNNGNLTIKDTTIKNHYSKGFGLIYGGKYSKTNLNGANISHCAVTEAGTVATIVGEKAKLNIDGNTLIEDNFAGGNGGLFKIQSGAKITMEDGEIINNKSVNSDGFIAMMYGNESSFILNGGNISENSGIAGHDNKFNGAFYIHSNGYFEMNGGTIENNRGFKRGAIDIAKTNADIKLNGGTIQNNDTHTGYENYSGVYLGYDYDINIGKNMIINDNIYITDSLVNNGKITGNVMISVEDKQNNILSGNGKINGELIIKYNNNENKKPNVSSKMVKGNLIFYDYVTHVLVTYMYNGGVDQKGLSRDVVSIPLDTIPSVPTPEKPGYTLTWYADKELTIPWEPTNTSLDTVVYAGWTINTYTVTWNINGSIVTRKFNYGELIQMPEEPSKTGYEFIGWSNYKEGMRMPDKDVTFVAKWKKIKK